MHETYGDRADFRTIYIKEAHPIDEWQLKDNVSQNVCYMQPKTLAQRVAIANDFVRRFDYGIPLVVDPIDNRANAAFAAWPERLYVIDERGKIVYKGKPGPFGYHPEEVEAWLKKRFAA
jgi:type I thyroxine 5'-deiodinase